MKKFFCAIAFIGALASCQSTQHQPTLYDELGGMPAIEKIAGNFIAEIGYNPVIAKHFQDTNLKHFRQMVIEHLCEISDGPCKYTGDPMAQAHKGKHITENEFNQTVDLTINAMNKAGIPHTTQNKLLARLAPLRSQIIYQ